MLFLARLVASLALLALLLPAVCGTSGGVLNTEQGGLKFSFDENNRNIINVSGYLHIDGIFTCQNFIRHEMLKHCGCKVPTGRSYLPFFRYQPMYAATRNNDLFPAKIALPVSAQDGARVRRSVHEYDDSSDYDKRDGSSNDMRGQLHYMAERCCKNDHTCNLREITAEINDNCNPNSLCYSQGDTHNGRK